MLRIDHSILRSLLFVAVGAGAPALGVSPASAAAPALNLQRFQPAPWAGSWLSLWAPAAADQAPMQASGFASWASRPLVFGSASGHNEAAVVSDLATLELGAAWRISPGLSAGLSVPLAAINRGEASAAGLQPPSGAALGDIRIAALATVPGRQNGLQLAFGAELGLPSAGSGSFAGDSGVSGGVRVILEWQRGGTSALGNWGVWARQPVELGPTSFGSETRGGIGLRQAIGDGWGLLGEASLAAPLAWSRIAGAGAAEFTLGGSRCFGQNWEAFAGMGGGGLQGPGAVSWRATAGLRQGGCGAAAVVVDRDRDSVPDPLDACPDQPGPAGVGAESPGCPDRDGDGVADRRDACPAMPGIRHGESSGHGCPADSDGDGAVDAADACPAQPGRLSPRRDHNGCPDLDGDGVPDSLDACPGTAGPESSSAERSGCPADRDGDGIADAQDACPDHVGRPNAEPGINGCPGDLDGDGVRDDDDRCPNVVGPKSEHRLLNGCPPPRLHGSHIGVAQRIEFDSDSAVVRDEFRPLLLQVALLLLEHPEILKLSVDGHTDDAATADHNMALSQARARAVHDQLVVLGVPANRLQWRGFGLQKPIVAGKTEEARRQNRRVEFVIAARR